MYNRYMLVKKIVIMLRWLASYVTVSSSVHPSASAQPEDNRPHKERMPLILWLSSGEFHGGHEILKTEPVSLVVNLVGMLSIGAGALWLLIAFIGSISLSDSPPVEVTITDFIPGAGLIIWPLIWVIWDWLSTPDKE